MSTIILKGKKALEYASRLAQEDKFPKGFGDRTEYMNSRDRCIVCGGERCMDISTRMIEPLVGHHVRYFPPLVAWAHYKCHKKIHDGQAQHLIQYEEGDARKYYESKREVVNQ